MRRRFCHGVRDARDTGSTRPYVPLTLRDLDHRNVRICAQNQRRAIAQDTRYDARKASSDREVFFHACSDHKRPLVGLL
jgi:hypothetical protein